MEPSDALLCCVCHDVGTIRGLFILRADVCKWLQLVFKDLLCHVNCSNSSNSNNNNNNLFIKHTFNIQLFIAQNV